MERKPLPVISVSECIALVNQTLEFAYPSLEVVGEVSSFKVNQGKFVFFDLKDESGSLGCFMMVYQLRIPIEDGMKVKVSATAKLTPWGKFSLTVRNIQPVGEGSLKKSFEILRKKLSDEGLFAPERKRPLPEMPARISVISSTQAAGYGDFIKIVNDRWGGMRIRTTHVQVQGESAPDQIIRALKEANEQELLPDVIVLVRGGGSADDLSVFNDEPLVRAIAASRAPVLTGIGHEVDVTLADEAADVRAATPSSAAQLLVPDKQEVIRRVQRDVTGLVPLLQRSIDDRIAEVRVRTSDALSEIILRHETLEAALAERTRLLRQFDPKQALQRGYALVRGNPAPGNSIEIETKQAYITAEVTDVRSK